ncbi:hypothetical protein [Hoeflea alexandrii]
MLDRAASIAAISSVRVLVSRNGGSSGWIEVMLSPADTGSPDRVFNPVEMSCNRRGDRVDIADPRDPVFRHAHLHRSGFHTRKVDEDRLFAEGDVEPAADGGCDNQSRKASGNNRGHCFSPLFSKHE